MKQQQQKDEYEELKVELVDDKGRTLNQGYQAQ